MASGSGGDKSTGRWQMQRKSREIKKSVYSLGKAPENLTSNQATRFEMIGRSDKQLYREYLLKEKLRLIFKFDDVDEAEHELSMG